MGFFDKKPKMTIEDCCRGFYDPMALKTQVISGFSKIENSNSSGIVVETDIYHPDFWSDFVGGCKKLIATIDGSFSTVNIDLFWHEMTALRMELFTLACSYKVKFKLEDLVREVFFTKHYLENYKRTDLWDSMLEYNDLIDHSAFMKADGESAEKQSAWRRGRIAFLVDPKDANMESAWCRERVTFLNTFRFGLFEDWQKKVGKAHPPTQDDEKTLCLCIAIKRVGANVTGADSLVVKLLASMLAERLGCGTNVSSETLFRLGSIIFGLHSGAEKHLKAVSLL